MQVYSLQARQRLTELLKEPWSVALHKLGSSRGSYRGPQWLPQYTPPPSHLVKSSRAAEEVLLGAQWALQILRTRLHTAKHGWSVVVSPACVHADGDTGGLHHFCHCVLV